MGSCLRVSLSFALQRQGNIFRTAGMGIPAERLSQFNI
jgi:hypothetical protein